MSSSYSTVLWVPSTKSEFLIKEGNFHAPMITNSEKKTCINSP